MKPKRWKQYLLVTVICCASLTFVHKTSAVSSLMLCFHLTFSRFPFKHLGEEHELPVTDSILIFFVEFWCFHTQIPNSLLFFSRPPDRRRRDLFGVANSTHPRRNRLHTNSSTVPPLQAAGNSSTTEVEPVDREFEFAEQSVTERELQITGLQPFTVYRIDIHACNRQVQRCSAAEFVFSRTKPAG